MTTNLEGLYHLTREEYDAIDAVNISSLVYMNISPKHYLDNLKNPKEETPAMRLGTAVDVAAFDPERFELEYAVWPGVDEEGKKRIRSGKYWEEFQAKNAGKTILTLEEHSSAIAMRHVLESDEVASQYLDDGTSQDALIWTDKATGIKCKGRTDWITAESSRHPDALGDLKTSESVEPWQFCRIGTRLHYPVKMAWYSDAFELITCQRLREVVLFAVESARCHDVVVYNMGDDVLSVGRLTYRKWLHELARCRDSGKYPGISRGMVLQFELPSYATADFDITGEE